MLYKIENVKKSYNDGEDIQSVLRGVSFDINEGEIIAIIGPSGCGKSTLLNLIGGIDKADEGKMLFENDDITKYNEKKLTKLRLNNFGFVFQSYHLISSLTVRENIMVPILAKGLTPSEEEITKICEEVNIDSKMYRYPHQLSGGERQRVAVARAIASKPKIIFADEATGNLDESNSINVMESLTEMAKKYNISVVFVTHDASMLKYADRVISLKEGTVEYEKN